MIENEKALRSAPFQPDLLFTSPYSDRTPDLVIWPNSKGYTYMLNILSRKASF